MRNYFHMIRKRLITLGVKPSHARYVALDFDKQVRSRGITGALEYFKDVGDTLVGHLSHSGYKAKWVATVGGYPKRWLCLRDYPLETQLRVAKMARALLLSEPTPKMVDKLRVAATSPYSGEAGAISELSRLINLGLAQVALVLPKFDYEFKSVVSQCRTYYSRSVPTGTAVGLDMESVLGTFHQWRNSIVQIPNWEMALYPIHPSWVGRNYSRFQPISHVGELGGVMENGGKLRMFAAPSVLLQAYLEPLQLWLDDIRKQIPSDVFKAQQLGAQWAQDKMRNGHHVQSIDLSSATCRFPFSVQLDLVRKLGAPKWASDLYSQVARSSWKSQPHMVAGFGEYIEWTVGQPLGVNPSMSSFALCHNLLLVGLCKELHLDVWDSFRVLGDDVVICHRSLAQRYRQVITSCGIGISEHKSYDSAEYAEFAGYSITPTVMVRPGRWKAASVLNVQGLVKDLGASVIEEIQQDHRLIERLLAFSSGDLNPDVQEWSYWLKLNTLLLTTNVVDLQLREKEITWYDGACAYLSRQFPGIYFGESNSKSFLELVGEGPHVDQAKSLLWPTLDWTPLSSVVLILESFMKDGMTIQDLITSIKTLQSIYEGYLWSLPKTSGRLERDRRRELQLAFNKLATEVA